MSLDAESQKIEDALKNWRSSEARKRGIPPYCVFNNQVLREIASVKPARDRELLAISGIGKTIVQNYAADIFRIVAGRNI